MTLRGRLTCALMAAALLPMAVAVGVMILRAAKTAQQEAEARLEAARKQALVLLDQHKSETVLRIERAAEDLARDPSALEPLRGSAIPAARETARWLAYRHGLDHLEIIGSDGTVLSTSQRDVGVGQLGALAGISEEDVQLRLLPPAAQAGTSRAGFFALRAVPLADERLSIAGGRAVDRQLVSAIAEITGGPASLVGVSGSVVEAAGDASPSRGRLTGEVRLGSADDGDWKIVVSVPAADVRRTRRDLLVAFAGIAPFALASALAVGVALAHGVSRPIRALAARADSISAEQSAPFSLPIEQDEVRSLALSFDRMLEALSQSEKQRLAAERVAAWQEVARRVAHEVKNSLSPIKLAVENLRRTREKAPAEFDRAFDEEASTILEEVESLRRLVDEFSQFARLPRPRPVPCDLEEIVLQALALFSPRIEEGGVRVELTHEGSLEPLLADREQLSRALKNVLTNALDALEPVADRRLAIALRRVEAAAGMEGEAVEIEVRDSGVGFEPEALRRVFEPYFTTRAERGGSGLGMAIAYRIVSEHGGMIRASGSPGSGATITIRLPMKGPPAA